MFFLKYKLQESTFTIFQSAISVLYRALLVPHTRAYTHHIDDV